LTGLLQRSPERKRTARDLGDPLFAIHNGLHVELASKAHVPAIGASRIFAAAGGLMSYGPSFYDLYKQAAAYVDKILKGAKPGNLPVEQPRDISS
jgi:putative tryptophan/tyrosine transport system substrate-binding protein